MSFITKAFEQMGRGIAGAFKATGEIAKGVLTLDLKGASTGVKNLVASELEVCRGGLNLTPAAVCANTLLNGAFDKLTTKIQSFGLSVATGVIDTVTNDLVQLKDGVIQTAHGLAKGNLGEMATGMVRTVDAAGKVSRDFTPSGLMRDTARSVVNTAINRTINTAINTAVNGPKENPR
jgi:hypothetical protein